MRRKLSRAALVAGVAIGASGLVAVPADAALTAADNAVSTPTYYVNGPAIGGVSNVTPESALVSGIIDTGGDAESLLPVPTGGLSWNGGIQIGSGVPWADNSSGNDVPVDGIPADGSNSNVSVTVADASLNASAPVISSVSNAGADNYSSVTFEYDPVSDYDNSGDQPGPQTQFAPDVDVPTTTGLSNVSTTLGAFGQKAQNNTGNTPLKPGTAYYYWIVQQPGGTDAATDVNIAKWADQPANPTDVCLPNAAIAQDKTLSGYTASTSIAVDGTTAAALEGSCIYYYGDPSGGINYQSPNGEFTTPALGRLAIGRNAKVKGRVATVKVTDNSTYNASVQLELDDSDGNVLATGKFGLRPGWSVNVKLQLTSIGVQDSQKHQSGQLTLTSEWDQPTATKSIKLLGTKPAKKTKKKGKKSS